MGILQMLGLSRPKQLPTVPTDIIYPSHMIDDDANFKQLVLSFSFKFNDVLDPGKLHNALARLLEIGEWRKLGGRVRLNENGRMEYHVPEKFTAARPAIAYSHEKLPMNITDHAAASKYLECDGTSRTFEDRPELVPFSRSSTAPKNFSDYLTSDHPLMALRITSFNDATIVGLLWPHFMMDIIGQTDLLRAWSLALNGKEDQVPPSIGASKDIAWHAGDPSVPLKEEWKMPSKAISGLGMVMLACRFIWAALFGPKLVSRTYVVTKQALHKLVSNARAEIGDQFVSEGDVLTAWVSKVSNKADGNKRDYNIIQVMNLRNRLPSIVEGGIYVTNLMMQTFTFWNAKYLKGTSVGEIALEHRRILEEQGTKDQVRGFLQHLRQATSKDPRRGAPLCIRPTADVFTFTSWAKSRLIQTPDFSRAVVRTGDMSKERQNPPGSMVIFDHRRQEQNLWVKGSTVIIGKDHAGNLWLWSIMTDRIWDTVDEELRKLDE